MQPVASIFAKFQVDERFFGFQFEHRHFPGNLPTPRRVRSLLHIRIPTSHFNVFIQKTPTSCVPSRFLFDFCPHFICQQFADRRKATNAIIKATNTCEHMFSRTCAAAEICMAGPQMSSDVLSQLKRKPDKLLSQRHLGSMTLPWNQQDFRIHRFRFHHHRAPKYEKRDLLSKLTGLRLAQKVFPSQGCQVSHKINAVWARMCGWLSSLRRAIVVVCSFLK